LVHVLPIRSLITEQIHITEIVTPTVRETCGLGGALNPKSTVDPPIDEDLPLLSFALELLAGVTPQELRVFFVAASELQVQSLELTLSTQSATKYFSIGWHGTSIGRKI
jgi:hypothetical protein